MLLTVCTLLAVGLHAPCRGVCLGGVGLWLDDNTDDIKTSYGQSVGVQCDPVMTKLSVLHPNFNTLNIKYYI